MAADLTSWKPSLVALDVDGTIVGYDQFFGSPTFSGGVRPAVGSAVRQISDRGVHVVLATGRSWHSTVRVLTALDLTSGYAVCSNGAVVVDVATGERVHVASFDATAPVSYFAEQIPDAALAVESPDGRFRVTGDFPADELDGDFRFVAHDELVDGSVTRLVVRWPNGDRHHLRDVARASGLPSVDYAIGYSAWLDIMPKGISKASGLAIVCDRLGVAAEDVLAFGDGHNDVDMLAWAGWGVAMGQSPDDVKVIADEVCDDVAYDGVATVLHRYVSTPA